MAVNCYFECLQFAASLASPVDYVDIVNEKYVAQRPSASAIPPIFVSRPIASQQLNMVEQPTCVSLQSSLCYATRIARRMAVPWISSNVAGVTVNAHETGEMHTQLQGSYCWCTIITNRGRELCAEQWSIGLRSPCLHECVVFSAETTIPNPPGEIQKKRPFG